VVHTGLAWRQAQVNGAIGASNTSDVHFDARHAGQYAPGGEGPGTHKPDEYGLRHE